MNIINRTIMEKLLIEPEVSLCVAGLLVASAVMIFRVYSKFVKNC